MKTETRIKIGINKSISADSRTADKVVSKDELKQSTIQHINDVRKALDFMNRELRRKALFHDFSKIDCIDWFYKDFKATQVEKADFKAEGNWFWHHVKSERHHLNDYCPDDVNLFDVMERIADITMAGMGRSGKVYDDTLNPDILEKAYKNTIDLILKNTEVKG